MDVEESDMPRMAVDIGRMSAVAYDTPEGVVSEGRLLGGSSDIPSHLRALEVWLGPLVAAVRPRRIYVERHTGRGKGSRTLMPTPAPSSPSPLATASRPTPR